MNEMNVDIQSIENRILQSNDKELEGIVVSEREFKKYNNESFVDFSKESFQLVLNYEKNGENDQKSFLVQIPSNINNNEESIRSNFNANEIYIYETVIPLYRSLLPEISLQPKFYASDDKNTLILEDLTHSGYRLQKSEQQLDLEHCKVALQLLAKFHALSIKVNEQKAEILTKITNKPTASLTARLCYLDRPIKFPYEEKFRRIVRHADVNFAENHPEVVLFFENYLQQMAKNFLSKFAKDSFNVLNHGEFYINNILFAYDSDGKVVDAKCTNFQYCHWSNPSFDLIFFFVTSMNYELFDEHFSGLLATYTTTFNTTLEVLDCKQKLNLEDVRQYIETNYEYLLFVLVSICPVAEAAGGEYLSEIELNNKFLDEERYNDVSNFWISYFIRKDIFSKYEDVAISIDKFTRNYESANDATILNYNLDYNVLKPGDGYMSGMIKLYFEYEKAGKSNLNSVYIKVPTLCVNFDSIKETNVYDLEVFFYEQVLPEMNRLWTGEPFSPVAYAVTDAKILVLEDLSIQGFKPGDKLKQLDYDHCRIALRTLATFHAISVKYFQTCDNSISSRLEEPFKAPTTVQNLGQAFYRKFLKVTKPLVTESTHRRLQLLQDKMPKSTIYGRYVDDFGLNVLAHGDYWTNNILFKYDELGRAQSCRILDWQLSRKASPVVDLIFFFVLSARFEVFDKYRESLLNLYVDRFNETLTALECGFLYTRAELDSAMKRYKYYYLFYLSNELPIPMDGEGNFDNVASSDEASPLYLSIAEKWLKYMDANELL